MLTSPILSFPLLFVTLELHWTKSSPLLHMFTVSCCVSCCDSYYQLRQLRAVVHSLTSDATASLLHAFITARLDYCSSLCWPSSRAITMHRWGPAFCRTPLRGASPNLAMLPAICWMCSTGSPSNREFRTCIITLVWRSILGLALAYLRDLTTR